MQIFLIYSLKRKIVSTTFFPVHFLLTADVCKGEDLAGVFGSWKSFTLRPSGGADNANLTAFGIA